MYGFLFVTHTLTLTRVLHFSYCVSHPTGDIVVETGAAGRVAGRACIADRRPVAEHHRFRRRRTATGRVPPGGRVARQSSGSDRQGTDAAGEGERREWQQGGQLATASGRRPADGYRL